MPGPRQRGLAQSREDGDVVIHADLAAPIDGHDVLAVVGHETLLAGFQCPRQLLDVPILVTQDAAQGQVIEPDPERGVDPQRGLQGQGRQAGTGRTQPGSRFRASIRKSSSSTTPTSRAW